MMKKELKKLIDFKFPERSCKDCLLYPCFNGIEKRACDFAKYGCIQFKIKQ